MDESDDRTWVRSLLAALVVGTVLLTGWWLAQPRSAEGDAVTGTPAAGGTSVAPGGGEGGDARDGSRSEGQPAVGRDPVLQEDGVRIDGYSATRDGLVLRYTTGVPECYGEVEVARVEEAADAVAVTLVAVPPADAAQVCIDLAVVGTVPVELAAPLGQREVVDGAFTPAVPVRPGGTDPHLE